MYEILFQYGPVTVTTFNLLMAVGFLVAMVVLVRFIKLKKINLSFFVNHFIHFVIWPLLGGRLLHIIEHFPVFKADPLRALYVWDLGFSPFGIFYTAIIVLYFFTRRSQEDFWGWLDAFSLSGLAGLLFIHLGHFFNGSHYGKPTELPWGIAFDTYNIPYTTPIHPAQLYSVLATFVIFSLTVRSVKRTHLTGVAGTLAIMLYSLSAFGIDFLHGAPSAYAKVNFLLVAALAFIFYIHCSHKKLFENKS